jgi:acetyl-CoA C-acetyltransferase
MNTVRRVAVLGGNRIPFARSDRAYANASNQDMLTATVDGLVERFGLEGQRLGEVAAGAVLKHSRDFNLTREAVLGSKLAPETAAYDVQQACGTGLETTIHVANKIALGQIESGIAGGVDTTSDAPLALNEDLRRTLLQARRAKSAAGRVRALTSLRPTQIVPDIPRNAEPRTGLSMGEHCALMAKEWSIGREEQDELAVASHRGLAAAYDTGFLDDLLTPYLGLERDMNMRPDASVESLAKLKPVFGDTMTAGNSTPLSDGASAVLLASEEWARERGLPVRAWFVDAETAAVDYVHKREGLLMAPAYAVPRLLDGAGAHAAGLRLLRDPRGIRRPGPVHAEGVGGRGVLPRASRPRRAARLDRPRQAQRARRLAGGGSSVRRDGRADRGRARQGAGGARLGPRADLDLRRGRPGHRRDHGADR